MRKFNKFVKNLDINMDKPRVFTVIRNKDKSGVSGKGRVLDGIVFHDGRTAIYWRSDKPSITVFNTFEEFKHIHIDSHPGNKTEIVWL